MKIPATIFYIILIGYLFLVDRKKSDGVSNAIWIPFIWILFALSRPISFWLAAWFGIGTSSNTAVEDGNPIEQVYLFALMAAGLHILIKRRLNWQALCIENAWICLFFLFAALSFSWSDYPFVSFKRWIKSLGAVIMVLVILSEQYPYKAIGLILRRTAYLLLPLSILFINYYPTLGRSYHTTGALINTGVTSHKNGLGSICMIYGIYFFWNLLLNKCQTCESEQRLRYPIYVIVIPMLTWLLYIADSATSIGCLVLAIFLFIISRQRAFAQNPRNIFVLGFLSIVTYGILNSAFDVKDTIIALLGRRPDLTTRVPMWKELLTMAEDPIAGFGFESFWLGNRLNFMIENWGMNRQAHNGYLDMYLNLGFIGVSLALAYILSGLRKVYHYLFLDYPSAILRLCVILIFLIYNWTENAFHLMSSLWILLLFAIIDSPFERIDSGNMVGK